jgi:hypothetical protein
MKRMMEEAEERMFWPSGDAICRGHILNGFLLEQLSEVPNSSPCALCSEVSATYVDLDEVRDIVVAVINAYRRRAIDELFHDDETESGYALPDQHIQDTWDVVNDLFEDAFDDELRDYVATTLEWGHWFKPGVLWLEGAELYVASWSGFRSLLRATDTDVVQLLSGALDNQAWTHEAADGIRPSEILPKVLELIDELDVVREIPVSTTWFRAVHVPAGEALSASRLGTAPTRQSSENRMNRAGQPMFYGAADSETASMEIGTPPPGEETVVGAWLPSRPMRVLNLVSTPNPPDLYDVERSWLRWRLLFLADFARDVSQPIGKHERTEYRATQVLMEFLRSRVPELDGILYRSSHTGQPCCAVDVDNLRCVDRDTYRDSALRLMLEGWRTP